jgi:hypothetical protein
MPARTCRWGSGGRVTLTKTDVAFAPNQLNAELNTGDTTFASRWRT